VPASEQRQERTIARLRERWDRDLRHDGPDGCPSARQQPEGCHVRPVTIPGAHDGRWVRANYIAGSLNTWGWVVLCIGVIELLVGLGVFAKNQFARWTGVVILSVNAVVQLMMMPAYPFWSLCIFTLDILAIYGLIAYGQHITD